jgi:hypothetical protein
MTLIVENGTNVANANSYASLITLRAYALARGVTLSVSDPTVEAQTFKAMDYIESFRSQFQGVKTYQSPTPQALQFPRAQYQNASTAYGIFIDCIQIANNVIPIELVNLLCQTVMAVNAGVDFENYNQSQQFITLEKVGPIEARYASPIEGGSSAGVPNVQSLQKMFDVLFYPCGSGSKFMTMRV